MEDLRTRQDAEDRLESLAHPAGDTLHDYRVWGCQPGCHLYRGGLPDSPAGGPSPGGHDHQS